MNNVKSSDIDGIKMNRDVIANLFKALSLNQAVPLRSENLSDIELKFTRNIFHSRSKRREYIIRQAGPGEINSRYFKKSGVEYDVKVLTVVVSNFESIQGELWNMYKLWMVDEAREDEVELINFT